MNTGKSWIAFTFAALVLLVWTVGPTMAAEKPNILFIHVDQMHWQAMSAYGNPHVKTPALDRMAAHARSLGAHAIVAVRFNTVEVMQGAAEMLAYGTGVIVEEES